MLKPVNPVRKEYSTFVGVDLGGARGKTTAVAVLRADLSGESPGPAEVLSVCARRSTGAGQEPWDDDAIVDLIEELGDGVAIAIDTPLTLPACLRCTREICPGQRACVDPAVMWLNSEGEQMQAQAYSEDLDRIAAVHHDGAVRISGRAPVQTRPRLYSYVHRCTEIDLHYRRGLFPRESVGQTPGPVTNRAHHLVRRLAGRGFELNRNLIEVSPRATVQALFDRHRARGYKRDADPWQTRAAIVEDLADSLSFAVQSRLSREETLANDHCFEALLASYTAYLWAAEGWEMPRGEPFADDGWIWAP
jgi:hypothetical protein